MVHEPFVCYCHFLGLEAKVLRAHGRTTLPTVEDWAMRGLPLGLGPADLGWPVSAAAGEDTDWDAGDLRDSSHDGMSAQRKRTPRHPGICTPGGKSWGDW